ncbi:hypothetical protein BDP27DRAFT_1493368 [Rhodocollybia butyracea]|uniref:Uncharacterized protein n=1 Tax=Rhodocollybia butyracea TaxID=206335 RepID=A0A9P5P7Q5_9AGAR|nr:hypothetical protein BDP27DRAFT_1493368 [Rhodocollybia butyracea]
MANENWGIKGEKSERGTTWRETRNEWRGPAEDELMSMKRGKVPVMLACSSCSQLHQRHETPSYQHRVASFLAGHYLMIVQRRTSLDGDNTGVDMNENGDEGEGEGVNGEVVVLFGGMSETITRNSNVLASNFISFHPSSQPPSVLGRLVCHCESFDESLDKRALTPGAASARIDYEQSPQIGRRH